MLNDIFYALRLLRRSPGYSLVVIAVVAVGITANLIAFGLFKATALTPVAGVADSGLLQYVGARTPGGEVIPLSYPDYADIRDREFPGLAAWAIQQLIVRHGDDTRLSPAEFVTGNYFEVMGTRAQLGRMLTPADAATPGLQPLVVLSDGLWRRAFGANPKIVGTILRLNNQPLTVVGIAAPDFHGGIVGLDTDLFVPITLYDALLGYRELVARNDHWVHAFMRPVGDRVRTEARARQVGATLAAEHPEAKNERAVIVPIWRWPYGAQSFLLPAVGLMGATSALLLVVVCANVAGLVLVRSLGRRAETAARLTLGASHARIVRQLTIESLVLAVPAAALGLGIPALLEPFLAAATGNVSVPLFFNAGPDGLVVAVTALLAIVSALIYGLVPAFRLARVDLASALRDDVTPGGVGAGRVRSALVVAQIAVAVVLLVGTALVVRTLDQAQRADAGFDPHNVAWATFDTRAGGYDEARGRLLYSRLLDRVRSDTAVTSAGLSAFLPLTLIDWMSWNAQPDGYQARPDEDLAAAVNIVSAGYFRTLGIPILAGRHFDETDRVDSEPGVSVNETFARRFWGSPAAALGHRVETNGHRTIVGVVRDIKYARLDESPRPYMYAPASQVYSASMTLQVRAGSDTAAVLARVRAVAQGVDPAMQVLQSGPLSSTRRAATSLYETLARMLTLIGALTVGVVALGVYGLVAYAVRQSRQAIGVRTALGATRPVIVRYFLRQGMTLAAVGIAIGI